MPVSVVRHEDTDRIALAFEGRRLPIARSVYFAVVQLVAETPDLYGSATRKDLAALAGVSPRTLDEFTAELVEHGLLHVVRRREDGLNLPNLYALGPAPGGGAAQSTTPVGCASAADDTQHTSSSSTSSSGEKKGGGGPAALPLPDDIDVSDELRVDAAELLRRKTKVDGKIATPEEVAKAAAAIAEFNRQSGSDFGLGAHLRAIVMRIRERPSYDAGAHVRLVQSAWRLKWWEKRQDSRRRGRPTPAVIYGHAGVFEQVVQDAVDEKNGREQSQVEPSRRFTRED